MSDVPVLEILPGELNLVIQRGSTFDHIFEYCNADEYTGEATTPINLTGYTGRMHIRATAGAPDPPELELTTANGKLVIGGTAGTVRVILSETDNLSIAFDEGVYDIELVAGAVVVPFLSGTIEFPTEVTR